MLWNNDVIQNIGITHSRRNLESMNYRYILQKKIVKERGFKIIVRVLFFNFFCFNQKITMISESSKFLFLYYQYTTKNIYLKEICRRMTRNQRNTRGNSSRTFTYHFNIVVNKEHMSENSKLPNSYILSSRGLEV